MIGTHNIEVVIVRLDFTTLVEVEVTTKDRESSHKAPHVTNTMDGYRRRIKKQLPPLWRGTQL